MLKVILKEVEFAVDPDAAFVPYNMHSHVIPFVVISVDMTFILKIGPEPDIEAVHGLLFVK
jgi:hypothetical protein